MIRRRGFTLIELVVVMTISAILAAIAIPLITDSQSKKTWYQEQVKSAVRYAQRQAVAQRRNIYVDVQAGQVQLCYAVPPGCSALTNLSDGQPYALPAPT